ncbi:methyltransferase domain-containing protein [Sulfuricurvum sp.]|uniref:class I SAM-dependent methyltransferase n=1 Tax=Sulfuricurvum sp. TaxID=2025608 RepID=UPI0026285D12|nr:methyltransferase domain-containing protein [Sulfuricurvum sp.]MDD2265307.1 methyltransferase [Sulfuricurvum sp.]MDD2784844.1 methyltransferase [Sulfuricurvum sp.]
MSPIRFRYQTIEFPNSDIHVRTLRDTQQYFDTDNMAEKLGISSASWPMFGVIWDSSKILAHLMSDFDIEGKRILEVGCGIGLASLVLNHRSANISATDYHPEAERFMDENTRINNDKLIPFIRAGWEDIESTLGEFDLIIGSDLLYERDHVELLAGFINRHTKRTCEVIIVDPGRGNHSNFSKKMVSLDFDHTQSKPIHTDYLTFPFKGQLLRYTR